jgi:transposase-like protein
MAGPHSSEFKRIAIALTLLPGASVVQVAQEVGVSESTLREWTRHEDIAIAETEPSDAGRDHSRLRSIAKFGIPLVVSVLSLGVACRADQRSASDAERALAEKVYVVVDPLYKHEDGGFHISVRNYGPVPLRSFAILTPIDASALDSSPGSARGASFEPDPPPGACEELILSGIATIDIQASFTLFEDARFRVWQLPSNSPATKISEQNATQLAEGFTGADFVEESRTPIKGCGSS